MTIGSRVARSCLIVAGLALSGLTGCFQMDYLVTLDDDLGGEATLDIAVDLDRMAYVMASVQKKFGGGEGSPTDDEVDQARQELLSQMDSGAFTEESMRAEIDPDLPAGVTLLDATQSREGLRTEVSVRFAFDHVSALNEMDIGPDSGPGSDSEPFGGIELIDEGDTFVLRNDPMNPVEEMENDSGMFEGVPGLVETMFSDLRIAFAIEAPFEIVEHNATRQEGDRLYWVYDFEALSGSEDTGIFVRYRR